MCIHLVSYLLISSFPFMQTTKTSASSKPPIYHLKIKIKTPNENP